MIALNRLTPQFNVGQIVKHRRYGYRGVVVAIDLVCKAPRAWYERNQTQPDRNQPWYHVIVDQSETTTYPAQTSLLADDSGNRNISNPMMKLFFGSFENGRYIRNAVPFRSW